MDTKQNKTDFLKFVKTKKAKLLNEPIYYEEEDFDKKNPFKILARGNKVNNFIFNYFTLGYEIQRGK